MEGSNEALTPDAIAGIPMLGGEAGKQLQVGALVSSRKNEILGEIQTSKTTHELGQRLAGLGRTNKDPGEKVIPNRVPEIRSEVERRAKVEVTNGLGSDEQFQLLESVTLAQYNGTVEVINAGYDNARVPPSGIDRPTTSLSTAKGDLRHLSEDLRAVSGERIPHESYYVPTPVGGFASELRGNPKLRRLADTIAGTDRSATKAIAVAVEDASSAAVVGYGTDGPGPLVPLKTYVTLEDLKHNVESVPVPPQGQRRRSGESSVFGLHKALTVDSGIPGVDLTPTYDAAAQALLRSYNGRVDSSKVLDDLSSSDESRRRRAVESLNERCVVVKHTGNQEQMKEKMRVIFEKLKPGLMREEGNDMRSLISQTSINSTIRGVSSLDKDSVVAITVELLPRNHPGEPGVGVVQFLLSR